jgi:hypothetical protein
MARGRHLLLLLGLLAAAPVDSKVPTLDLTLAKSGWGDAPRDNAQAVFRSVGQQLLPHFPGVDIEPIFIQPDGGPITLYRRNRDKQIVVKLSTTDTHWAQYAFQFAHELGHVLCRFDDNVGQTLWLEESLCELSSIYCLRQMAREWETRPPYPNWKGYAKHLAKYAQDRIDAHPLPEGQSLAQWYGANADALAKNATDRDRNTIVAAALLPMFEKEPRHWAAVHYLNQAKPRGGKWTLEQHLQRWHDQTPAEHKGFVWALAKELGITLRD